MDKLLGSYIIYNRANKIIGQDVQCWDEGIEWTGRTIYKIMENDSRGNWVKRLLMPSNNAYSGDSYTLEERTIVYY